MRNLFAEEPEKIFYLVLGAASVLILAAVGYAYLGTFVFGLFTYYATRPLYRRVVRHLGRPRIAAVLTIVSFIVPFVGLLWYSGLIALNELEAFIETQDSAVLEQYLTQYLGTELQYTQFVEYVQSASNASQITDTVLTYVSLVASFLINALLVATFTYYALKDGSRFRTELDSMIPNDEALHAFVDAVDQDLQILFFGNILHAALTGVIGSVTYTLLNLLAPAGTPVPYPVLAGMGAGAASLIPVIGMKIVYIPLTGVIAMASYQTGPETYWFPATFAVVSLVVVDTIPDFIIRPYVSGERLHLGALMFAYIIGPFLFGWYGLFLAPMLLVIVTNFYTCILRERYSSPPERMADEGDTVLVSVGDDLREAVVEEPDLGDGGQRVRVRYTGVPGDDEAEPEWLDVAKTVPWEDVEPADVEADEEEEEEEEE